MEIKDLNALQLGALVQNGFEQYWQTTMVHVTISSTWASDLAIALWFDKKTDEKSAIRETIENGWEAWKTNFDMASQLIMACNYLAWFCCYAECYREYSKIFSREYHSLMLQAEKVMSDEELDRLARILD